MKSIYLLIVLSLCFACKAQPKKAQFIAKIPFELHKDIIYIKLKVNDLDSLNFIFDTGAGGTLISQSLGERLKLNNGFTATNMGAAGTHGVDIFQGNTIHIGQLKIKNIALMKDRNELESKVLHEQLDGVIGYDILSKYVVEINYDQQYLAFYDFKNFEYTGKGKAYKFNKYANIPYLQFAFKVGTQDYKGNFLIDTGASADIVLDSKFVRKNKIIDQVEKLYQIEADIGTSKTKTKLSIAKISKLSIFNQDFFSVPCMLMQSDRGVLALDQFYGVLGNTMLKRFNATYNYQKSKMYLSPNSLFDNNFKVDCFGAIFKDELSKSKLIIKYMIKNSPAERAGLKIHDEILKINNIPITKMSADYFDKIFYKNGEEIKIEYKRNGEIKQMIVQLTALI